LGKICDWTPQVFNVASISANSPKQQMQLATKSATLPDRQENKAPEPLNTQRKQLATKAPKAPENKVAPQKENVTGQKRTREEPAEDWRCLTVTAAINQYQGYHLLPLTVQPLSVVYNAAVTIAPDVLNEEIRRRIQADNSDTVALFIEKIIANAEKSGNGGIEGSWGVNSLHGSIAVQNFEDPTLLYTLNYIDVKIDGYKRKNDNTDLENVRNKTVLAIVLGRKVNGRWQSYNVMMSFNEDNVSAWQAFSAYMSNHYDKNAKQAFEQLRKETEIMWKDVDPSKWADNGLKYMGQTARLSYDYRFYYQTKGVDEMLDSEDFRNSSDSGEDEEEPTDEPSEIIINDDDNSK
jgi:hypothetical protein